MRKAFQAKYMISVILPAALCLFLLLVYMGSKNEIAVLGEKIISMESEMDLLAKEKAGLMLKVDSIGAPDKIKYIKGYQGKMMVTEKTTFKLMPTGASEILATLEAGTMVEVLAVGEITSFDPC